jgi:transposase
MQMAERRAEGIRLLQAGVMRQVQIARQLGITEAAVSKWRRKFEEDGPQISELHKATGRPPKLDEDAKQRLLDRLKREIKMDGFRSEIWTLARVKKLIQQEFGVNYNHNYIYRLLKDLGWKLIKPGSRGLVYEEEFDFDNNKQTGRIKINDYRSGRKIVRVI